MFWNILRNLPKYECVADVADASESEGVAGPLGFLGARAWVLVDLQLIVELGQAVGALKGRVMSHVFGGLLFNVRHVTLILLVVQRKAGGEGGLATDLLQTDPVFSQTEKNGRGFEIISTFTSTCNCER